MAWEMNTADFVQVAASLLALSRADHLRRLQLHPQPETTRDLRQGHRQQHRGGHRSRAEVGRVPGQLEALIAGEDTGRNLADWAADFST